MYSQDSLDVVVRSSINILYTSTVQCVMVVHIEWNPSKADNLEPHIFVHYNGVSIMEGLYRC